MFHLFKKRRDPNKVGHFNINGNKVEVFKDPDAKLFPYYTISDTGLVSTNDVQTILDVKRAEHGKRPPFFRAGESAQPKPKPKRGKA